MKKICHLILAVFFIGSMGFVLINCAPVEDVEDIVVEDDYMDFSDVEEEHTVGGSPCPQNLSNVKVYSTGSKGDLEPIDSAVFTCQHPAVDIYVNDDKGTTSCSFENTNQNTLNIDFNCGQTTDVNAEVFCSFYNKDTLKETKSLKVNLTVK